MDITNVLENQSFVHVGVDLAKNVFQVAYKVPHTDIWIDLEDADPQKKLRLGEPEYLNWDLDKL